MLYFSTIQLSTETEMLPDSSSLAAGAAPLVGLGAVVAAGGADVLVGASPQATSKLATSKLTSSKATEKMRLRIFVLIVSSYKFLTCSNETDFARYDE
jgi:hypothetical protein